MKDTNGKNEAEVNSDKFAEISFTIFLASCQMSLCVSSNGEMIGFKLWGVGETTVPPPQPQALPSLKPWKCWRMPLEILGSGKW